jgi:hypothetical protein
MRSRAIDSRGDTPPLLTISAAGRPTNLRRQEVSGRRSFASGLQRLGVAPHIVELALNHRSGTFGGVARIYQRHRYAKEVREAFEFWSQHVEALTTKKVAAA